MGKKNNNQIIKTPSEERMASIANESVGNYEKHSFFVKKTTEARKLLIKVGVPE
jgi:hypothetical protein